MQPIEYDAELLHTLWASGVSYPEIAAALGCSQSYVFRLKERHKLPNRQRSNREVFDDDPTPEEIAERAAECRAKRQQPATPKEERVSTRVFGWDGHMFNVIS